MGSYNVGAMGSSPYYGAKPRKASSENDERSISKKRVEELTKDFKDESFNGWGVAGLTGVGAFTGGAIDTGRILYELAEHADKVTDGMKKAEIDTFVNNSLSSKWKGTAIVAGIALAGGLLWEKLRSDGAKKHNTELLEKLRNEENN